ncbi:MAG TPA: Crp/Fnr family transcriptional regulator [Clostridia bacterium]|nr:Crp/Fnr family transcriptional regulator [Clostridia bacterium]
MKKYLELLAKNPLFRNIKNTEMSFLLKCLSARIEVFEKNSYIFTAGEIISNIGIVVSGKAHIIKDDHWGNRTILSNLIRGELFGEAFIFADLEVSPISVVAVERCEILFLDSHKLLTTCPKPCLYHTAIISNMVKILAQKTLQLTQKMHFITQKKTRDKLLNYLSYQEVRVKSKSFNIPFNRQELADYLSVERSAMSKELCKMRDEGILEFNKSHFTLK